MAGYKGERKTVKTTGSRTRINIMGVLNLNALSHPVICEYQIIIEYNVFGFFNEICKVYPDYNQPLHIILDGAGYHHAALVKDWAEMVNVKLHYLPHYSPNLNPIARMWKVMNEYARNNRYFSNPREFRDAISAFFKQRLPKIADSLSTRINESAISGAENCILRFIEYIQINGANSNRVIELAWFL